MLLLIRSYFCREYPINRDFWGLPTAERVRPMACQLIGYYPTKRDLTLPIYILPQDIWNHKISNILVLIPLQHHIRRQLPKPHPRRRRQMWLQATYPYYNHTPYAQLQLPGLFPASNVFCRHTLFSRLTFFVSTLYTHWQFQFSRRRGSSGCQRWANNSVFEYFPIAKTE